MTILTYKIECETGPHSVNITDWRFMTNCTYYYGNNASTPGTRIIIPDQMIDIMGYTPNMIREVILKDEIIENVLFSTNHRWHPGWCIKCSGLGKLDWVTSAMQNNDIRSDRYARLFKRNKERILLYGDSNRAGGYIFGYIFAPAIAEESKAESICKYCSGTGLHLDARHSLFSELKGLRHKLKEFTWNGKDVPRPYSKKIAKI